jgi:hypothetical protein
MTPHPVTLNSPWPELNTPERWRQWLNIAAVEVPDSADWWSDMEGCEGCRHLDAANVWCRLRSLPASWTPVLNMLGMACCGFGHEPVEQLELDLRPIVEAL